MSREIEDIYGRL